jgi:uncharacterized GH25 family protein
MENLIHNSEINDQDERVRPGEPTKSAAVKFADEKGGVACLNIEDGCWYLWSQYEADIPMITTQMIDKAFAEGAIAL